MVFFQKKIGTKLESSTSYKYYLVVLSFLAYLEAVLQDPETQPATRAWPSIDVGTEIFNGQGSVTASWIVSDFDVLTSLHTTARGA